MEGITVAGVNNYIVIALLLFFFISIMLGFLVSFFVSKKALSNLSGITAALVIAMSIVHYVSKEDSNALENIEDYYAVSFKSPSSNSKINPINVRKSNKYVIVNFEHDNNVYSNARLKIEKLSPGERHYTLLLNPDDNPSEVSYSHDNETENQANNRSLFSESFEDVGDSYDHWEEFSP